MNTKYLQQKKYENNFKKKLRGVSCCRNKSRLHLQQCLGTLSTVFFLFCVKIKDTLYVFTYSFLVVFDI
jgi:hypothetical protein